MSHINPIGHKDHYRSAARQSASDQLLPTLISVAGGTHPTTVVIECQVDPATVERAHELVYSAAWFHAHDGSWIPRSDHNPDRLALALRFDIQEVSPSGLTVRVRPGD